MKRILLITTGFIILAFIVIQFFQPEKNLSEPTTDDFFMQITDMPDSIKINIENACYDCHSNKTKYPFYAKIAPLSWYINKHVVEGKEELNFSEWGTFSKREKISALVDICEVLDKGSMPLKEYIKLHREASLSEKQVTDICNWTDELASEIMKP